MSSAPMTSPPAHVVICSCEDTMPLDAGTVRRGCRGKEVTTARQLCRSEPDRFRTLARDAAALTIGCTQEALFFSDVAAENGRTSPISYANLREAAGWSSDGAEAGPKMAALLAAAAEPVPGVPLIDVESSDVILIYGRGEEAVEAGTLLKEHFDVTVMIEAPAAIAPGTALHRARFARRLSARRSAPSCCAAASNIEGARSHRHFHQAALYRFRFTALRPLALADYRLHALPRSLPRRRHCAGGRPCEHRSVSLRGVVAGRRGR